MNEADRLRWARALWVGGWLCLVSYVGIIVYLVRRAAAIGEASFEDGLWWQRVEQVSFAALPQNLIVLVPAAAAAVTGTVLVRTVVDRLVLSLAQLTRVIAGVAFVVIALAGLGIVGIFVRQSDGIADVQAFMLRLGGILMSIAIVRLCFEAERSG